MSSLFAASSADVPFPILSALVVTPFLGALLMLVLPNGRPEYFKQVAFLVSGAVAGMTAWVMVEFDKHTADEFQFVDSAEGIAGLGISWTLGLDGISLWLVVLTAALFPLAILAIEAEHTPKAYYAWLLVLEAGVMGVFLALDLFAFFVFFEIVLVPMYFLIGQWGHGARAYAATKFFVYTMFGSAFMLVGILATAFLTAAETGNAVSFDLVYLAEEQALATTTARWIFLSFAVAFAVKVPLFPVHTWLPDAHTNAPTAGSVILAGVMLKLGTYGFIRISIPMLPEAAEAWAPVIGLLAVIGIIYGALGCLAQTDMKRLIAFSSVAHMGFVMLGISTLTDFGINAAIFGMVAHGLITGMLFFIAGSVKDRYHTLEIGCLGGMLIQVPRLGWILGFTSMASLGLPGLAGFWGEFPAILSAYQPANGLPVETFRGYMVVAAVGTVLAAGYLLWLLQRTAMGEPSEEFANDPEIVDVTPLEWASWTPFLFLIVLFGVAPGLIFEVTDPAVVESLNSCLQFENGCDGVADATTAALGG